MEADLTYLQLQSSNSSSNSTSSLPKDYTANLIAEVFSLAVYSFFFILVSFIYIYRKIYQLNYLWLFAGDWHFKTSSNCLSSIATSLTGSQERWTKRKQVIRHKILFYILLQFFISWLVWRIVTNSLTLAANALTVKLPSTGPFFNISYSFSWMGFYLYNLLTMLLILSWLKVSMSLYSVWNPVIGKIITGFVSVVLVFCFIVSTLNAFPTFTQEMIYLARPDLAKYRPFVINSICIPILVGTQLLLTMLIVLLGITIAIMISLTNKSNSRKKEEAELKDEAGDKEKHNMEQLFYKILIAVLAFVLSLVLRCVGMIFLNLSFPFWARGFLTRALPEMFSCAGMAFVFWPLSILCCAQQKTLSKAAAVLFAPVKLGDETDSDSAITPRGPKELEETKAEFKQAGNASPVITPPGTPSQSEAMLSQHPTIL